MKKYKFITKEIAELEDVICNKCGESTTTECGYEAMTCDAFWGYGSTRDGTQITFHLCEKCTYDFVSTLKVLPETKE